MKRNIVILAIALILTGLLGFSSISLAQGGKWEKKADMPTARQFLSASAVNGLIYAMGGQDAFDDHLRRLATVEVYNPATDTWKKGTDMLAPRSQFATAVVDGKIYVFGGFSLVERRGRKIGKTLVTVDVYDPATNTWEQKGNAPTARERMAASTSNGKVYITGGHRNDGGGGDQLEIYDPATDTWQQGPNKHENVWLLSSAAVNGKVYTFGGWFFGNLIFATVEEFDPATNQWSQKADMPTARQLLSPNSPVVNGKVYVVGGNDGNAPLTPLEVYDPATDTWEKQKKMKSIRQSLAAVDVKGKIYVIGGWDGKKVLASVAEYTPEGWPFAVSPQGKLATAWGTIKTVD